MYVFFLGSFSTSNPGFTFAKFAMDCPIARLNNDILWKIFLENTETYNDNRLTTARHSSQVSRQWREIMLQSSSIWGRVIDLDDLYNSGRAVDQGPPPVTSHNWLREVVSRTGNALLWIIGDMCYILDHALNRDFLLTFIEENWDRIQRLDISDRWSARQFIDGENVVRRQYWHDLFKKSAPFLQEFVFVHSISGGSLLQDARQGWILPSPVFKGTAPALKKFEIYRKGMFNLTNFKFTMDMPTSWLSKLRSLTIRQNCNINQVLAILEITPLLEDLTIDGYPYKSTENPGREIFHANLPKLAFVSLYKWRLRAPDMFTFLERISPSRGCCFLISNPSYPNVIVNLQDIERFQVLIMRYVQDFFEYHPSTCMTLSCNDRFLKIGEHSISESRHSLSMWMPLGEDNTALIQTVFNSPFFSTVVDLDLSDWMKGLPTPLSAFDSVTTLWIEYETLMSLLQYMQKGYDSMFLLVDVLKIGRSKLRLDNEYREPLGLFLQHRRTLDQPISVLDLSPSYQNLTCDLDNLEDLIGLVVKWRFTWDKPGEEYVCGSGHPDVLRFKTNYPDNGIYADSNRNRGYGRIRIPYSPAKEGWSGQIAYI